MTDIAARHRDALGATRRVVAGVGRDQWSEPTPCAEWNVGQLLNHIIAGNWWAAELGRGATIEQVGSKLDGDQLGDDALGSYDRSAEAAAAAFEAPGALDAPCAVSYGPVPGSVYAGHRFIDVLIHGWDLAAATGQDRTLDPKLVEACWDVVQPQAELLQGSGMFAERGHDFARQRPSDPPAGRAGTPRLRDVTTAPPLDDVARALGLRRCGQVLVGGPLAVLEQHVLRVDGEVEVGRLDVATVDEDGAGRLCGVHVVAVGVGQ